MFENFQITCTGVDVIQFNDNKNTDLTEKLKKKTHHRNMLIPKVIYSLYPKIKFDEYVGMTSDAVFTCKVALVCENCYLDITSYCSFASNTEHLLRTIRPFHGNIYHTSARKPLTASNFNNVNFIRENKPFKEKNVLNSFLENEKSRKLLKDQTQKEQKIEVHHRKSKSEGFTMKIMKNIKSPALKLGEKLLPDIKMNNKIMNKIIKRNPNLNRSQGTEFTDISEANSNFNHRNVNFKYNQEF
jgi:hypothetical protein